MSVNTNNPMSGSSESVAAPEALNSFFANIPAKGNVVEKNEDPKDDDAPKDEPKGDEPNDEPKEGDEPKEDPAKPNTPATPAAPASTSTDDDDDEEDSVIHTLASAIGEEFELEGEFEDSEEGVVAVTKQIVQKSKELGQKEGVEILFAKNPLLKDVADHLEKGGSLISLIQTKQIEDFSKVEIKEDDVDAQERMFRTAMDVRGLDKDSIEDLVNAAKNSGALFTRSIQSQEFLVDKQKEVVDAQIRQEQADRKKQLEDDKETEDNVKRILQSGKIHGMDITSDVAKRLETFAFKQDAKGVTERDTKWSNLTPEQWLTLDLIVMEDFKPVTNGKVITPKSKPMKLKVTKAKPTINLTTSNASGKVTRTGVDASLNKLGITDVRDLFGGKKD